MFRIDGDHITGETGRLRIVFDGTTGGVRRLENLVTGHVVADGDAPAPWRATPQGAAMRGPFSPANRPPSYRLPDLRPEAMEADIVPDGSSATFAWTASDPGIRVVVAASVGPEDAFEFRPRVEVADDALPPMDLAYPLIASPRALSEDGVRDVAVYPQHSGWLIRRPLQHPPLVAPYPDGCSGCSLQLMAYLEDGVGGFSLAAHDPRSTWKTLAFGAHEWSITQETWDLRRGAAIDYGYPIVIPPWSRASGTKRPNGTARGRWPRRQGSGPTASSSSSSSHGT